MIRALLVAVTLASATGATGASAQAPCFEGAVGYELSQVLRGNDVSLSPGGNQPNPTFYSEDFNRVEEVRCEQSAVFGLIARANMTGNILVAVCEAEAVRVRGLARDAKRGLESVIKQLRAAGTRVDDALVNARWSYQHVTAKDGEEHHFPVLMIGHGIVGPQTMVFSPRGERRVIVIQGDLSRHCENYGLSSTALCADTRGTLAQLGRRVLARMRR